MALAGSQNEYDAPQMFARIERDLQDYEAAARWTHSNVVHGDPVFSNVLLTDDGRIYLLDMRGELGNVLTLQGDLTYDLSKVYQSLLGYDYIILSQPLHERDAELLEELRRTFRTFVRDAVHVSIVAASTVCPVLQRARAAIGTYQNRLDFAGQNLASTQENTESARSTLMDLDVCAPSMFFSIHPELVITNWLSKT